MGKAQPLPPEHPTARLLIAIGLYDDDFDEMVDVQYWAARTCTELREHVDVIMASGDQMPVLCATAQAYADLLIHNLAGHEIELDHWLQQLLNAIYLELTGDQGGEQ